MEAVRKPSRVVSYGITDVGRKRPHNEDAYLRDDELGLYVVCDGVGGHEGGEVASQESVEQLHGWIHAERARMASYREKPSIDGELELRRIVESGVQQAAYMVSGISSLDPIRQGMSTTLSALLVVPPIGLIAQVGDSRVYRLRGGKARQLTEDHTLINYKLKHGLITEEEARNAPGKNVITRAVGHKEYVEVDTIPVEVRPGDRYLLCSDGLHGYLEDPEELGPLLALAAMKDAAKAMVAVANERGGKDNITAVIVSIES